MRIVNLLCDGMPAETEKYNEFPWCTDSKNPEFSFAVEGDDVNSEVKYYKILVSTSAELLDDSTGDMWDSGIVKSNVTIGINYRGKTLRSNTKYYFRVYAMVGEKAIKSKTGVFVTGLYGRSDWEGCFISAPKKFYFKSDVAKLAKTGGRAPHFRKEFEVQKKVVRATAYATALGIYDLYVNGKRPSKYELAPGWTEYPKSIQYQIHDVTDHIKEGKNAIGAIVGDGWYASNLSGLGRARYGTEPAFMLQLFIEYEDGSEDRLSTDPTWTVSSGAVIYSDNQNGEYYDARLECDGWCLPDFNTANSSKVNPVKQPFVYNSRLKASVGPQVREMLTVDPVSIEEVDGKYIVDMGQNMVGRVSVAFRCPEGTEITIRHGEMLNDADEGERGSDGKKGSLYTANLRSALQKDVYICKGHDDVYEPRFTFHGFRYVEISGLDKAPELSDIKGHVIYSACERVGYIETSDESVNKLISNVLWGQRGNFVSLPTDCPQRDERLGWTGDAEVFCKTACYTMDCHSFYLKYLEDLFEAQKPNGSITDIAPMIKWDNGSDLVGNGNAAWGDAAFVIPYTLYCMYGDKSVIDKYYRDMQRYFEYLNGTTRGYIRPDRGYGDWLSIDDFTPHDVLCTAFFAYDAILMRQMAKVLGKKEDEKYYKEMFLKIRAAFHENFVAPDGKIKGDTQTCYLMAIKFGLVCGKLRKKAEEHLIRRIEEKNYHLSTGFVGVSYLLPILCDIGRADIAYRLLHTDTYPSWLYSIRNGATTIWERWNSYTLEKGFGNVSMNSFNHYSLGSVVEWMFAYMAGIKPRNPGFSVIEISPVYSETLDHVKCSYNSIMGKIKSSWCRTETGYELEFTIPANTTAYVTFDKDRSLIVQGKPQAFVKGGAMFGPGTGKIRIENI